jgi:hypothetical protein
MNEKVIHIRIPNLGFTVLILIYTQSNLTLVLFETLFLKNDSHISAISQHPLINTLVFNRKKPIFLKQNINKKSGALIRRA